MGQVQTDRVEANEGDPKSEQLIHSPSDDTRDRETSSQPVLQILDILQGCPDQRYVNAETKSKVRQTKN